MSKLAKYMYAVLKFERFWGSVCSYVFLISEKSEARVRRKIVLKKKSVISFKKIDSIAEGRFSQNIHQIDKI